MKQFCTINQQINVLKSRGMKFKSVKFAKDVLNNVNYYNIINAFKDLFVIEDSKEEKYIDNLFFEEVYDVYLFNRELRHLFLRYILLLEDILRTNVAYVFGNEEGPYQHLDEKAFNSNVNSQYITDMIDKINSIIENSRDDMVGHFKSMNEPLPILVLVNTFDFNLIKTFYLNMKYNQKLMIANKYSITIKEYKSFLQTLNMYRNVCANDYRLLF